MALGLSKVGSICARNWPKGFTVPVFIPHSCIALSFSTISAMEGLILRSCSTHCNPISTHILICWRRSGSNDVYLDDMWPSVQLFCTYRFGCSSVISCIRTKSNLVYWKNIFILEIQNNMILLSINFRPHLSSALGIFFSPVLIWIISRPKLYMSDWVEISPLYRYSGAIYPLNRVR